MIIIVLISALFLAFSLIFCFAILCDIVFIGHDFPTTKRAVRKVCGIIKQYGRSAGVVYDLGSARGAFLLSILGQCPCLKGVGIDSRLFRTMMARVGAIVRRLPARFVTGDIFESDISDADVVYVYLGDWLMPRIEHRLAEVLRPGTLVILNTQHLPTRRPLEVRITHPEKPEYERMYIYQI